MKNKLISYNLFYLFIIILYVSCSNNSGNRVNSKGSDKKDTVLNKPPSSYSDTIIINYPAAVFYMPDSIQLEKIKAVTDIMVFESNMHDCYYQMRYSRIVIQKNWPGIKITEIKNARYIFLKKADGNNKIIDLNNKNDACGVFLFDGRKTPRLVDMTNIDTELGFYFSE